MLILGLDLGNEMGFALLENGSRSDSGTWDFRKCGSGQEKFSLLLSLIEDVIPYDPHLIAYEEVRFVGRFGIPAAISQAKWEAWLQACSASWDPGWPTKAFTVREIRKTAFPARKKSYQMGKKSMMQAAIKEWAPHVPGTQHEADALWVAGTAYNSLTFSPPEVVNPDDERPYRNK